MGTWRQTVGDIHMLLRWSFTILLLVLTLFVCLSWLSAQRLTRARPSVVGVAPKDFPYLLENVTLTTRDQHTLAGWFLSAEDKSQAIILLHGFGGNRLSMLPRARFLRQQGYNVLL